MTFFRSSGDAMLLQDLLGASKVVASGSLGQGAKAAKDKVKDKVEDVQEAWETSQVRLVPRTHDTRSPDRGDKALLDRRVDFQLLLG